MRLNAMGSSGPLRGFVCATVFAGFAVTCPAYAQDECSGMSGVASMEEATRLEQAGDCEKAVACFEYGREDSTVPDELVAVAVYLVAPCYRKLGKVLTAMRLLGEAYESIEKRYRAASYDERDELRKDRTRIWQEWVDSAKETIHAAKGQNGTPCRWIEQTMDPATAKSPFQYHYLLGRCLKHVTCEGAMEPLELARGGARTPEDAMLVRTELRECYLRMAQSDDVERSTRCQWAERVLELDPDPVEKSQAEAVQEACGSRISRRREPPPPPPPPPREPGFSPYAAAESRYERPDEPVVDRHRHTGFFLRMATGLGYAACGTEGFDEELSVSGLGSSISFDIGGALLEDLILHARLSLLQLIEPNIEVGGRDVELSAEDNRGIFYVLLAPAMTYYLMPANIYVTFAFGVGGAHSEGLWDVDPGGWGLDSDVGVEFWVDNEWGLGVVLRVSYLSVTLGEPYDEDDWSADDEVEADLHAAGFIVVLAATYN